MTEDLKEKSHWCLLIDLPACMLILPFMAIGIIFTLAEIGYTYGRDKTEKWFMRDYKKSKQENDNGSAEEGQTTGQSAGQKQA